MKKLWLTILTIMIIILLLAIDANKKRDHGGAPYLEPPIRSELSARYGDPDIDDSTAYDRPRPIIVTRILRYTKAKVQIAYVADAPVGAAPPYVGWKFLAFQDADTKQPISLAEATRRLDAAMKQR